PVLVENRPGAGSTIGAAFVARSPQDGYTLLFTANSIALSPLAYKDLSYDVVKDLAPVSMLVRAPYLLVVNSALPVNSVADLVQMAKDKPGTVRLGSGGIGTIQHLSTELLKVVAGV